ncbi:MAG: glycosyl transferase, family 2 [Sphingomonas bacterium]|nr:glycosyltransferase family 2 protein [Sphingomonas bacterium]MDB5689567.1 glycosyl transferase, family 2 [Sphingomonas bacterium]
MIIPALDASATIGRAVASALAQPEVSEVIVVDDGSRDGTGAAALAADDGSARLKLIRFEANCGPAAARNAAFDAGAAPFVAILDADDYLLPGRFAEMAGGAWDMLADNIVFLPEGGESGLDPARLDRLSRRRRLLGLDEFVARNISRRGRPRAELGFLKPVIRREALLRLGLRYDERLRLGEDFILYATALARGARIEIAGRCGYVAIERAGSLSGQHRTADLAALVEAETALLGEVAGRQAGDPAVLERHLASVRRKLHHRLFLDARRNAGLLRAVAGLLPQPWVLAGVAADVLQDKIGRPVAARPAQRLLFEASDFAL